MWQSVLLVEETGVPRKKHRPVATHVRILWMNLGCTRLLSIVQFEQYILWRSSNSSNSWVLSLNQHI